MRFALAVAIALSSTGCFTSWVATQIGGGQFILDESVREQNVPLAGVEEKLAVSIPLAIEYDSSDPSTTSPQNRTERPFALTCSTQQYAQDRVYHSAFRYGSRWKKWSGVMFLAEAALAATFLLIDENRDRTDPMKANDRSGLIAGGILAIDAIGTAAIFFIPRKEVFTVDDKAIMTPVRDDCPEALVLDIAGTSFPIDAAGRIGELGEAALDEWMRARPGALALTFEGKAMPLRLSAREVCAWMQARHADEVESVQNACAGQLVTTTDLPRLTTAVITVPTGSLSAAISQ